MRKKSDGNSWRSAHAKHGRAALSHDIGGMSGYAQVLIIAIIVVAAGLYIQRTLCTDDDATITLYAFSIKGEVFDEKIIPAFRDHWLDMTGEVVRFETVYDGSGSITKKVLSGAPAEVMVLSTGWDAFQLRKNGLVRTDWNEFPHNGVISRSPWIIMTRESGHKDIGDFQDLTNSSVELIHADPLTSGGACWSVLAVYGSALKASEAMTGVRDTDGGEQLLEGVAENVISWQPSARKALSQFVLGYGDALITYEADAFLAREQEGGFELVYPRSTIFSEHNVVLVDENVGADERGTVEEFIQFLYTDEVQGYLADYGFRSVDEAINDGHEEFAEIILPFDIGYFGGWEQAHQEIIDGIYPEIRGHD